MTGRPPAIIRPVKLTTHLPEDLKARLDLHLFSAVEGRVPHGAYSEFLCGLIRKFFEPKPPNEADRLLVLAREELSRHMFIADPDGGIDWNDEDVCKLLNIIDAYLGASNANPVT